MPAEVRASWSKVAVSRAKRALSGGERERALRELEVVRAPLREAGILGWVPAELHADVCRAIVRALGQDRARIFWADLMNESMRSPLMRPIVSAALSIDGRTPESLIRRAPRVWELVTRGAGELTATKVDSGMRLDFVQLPRAFCEIAFLLTQVGTCDACLAAVGTTGEVTTELDPSAARARLTVRW
ncbi:hypothetical protein [Sandaracinus amylolyticus]|uniref:hypothetical protein n=1 Tax=Sandaracinus amylolyticus TaxID=927083 RepID=UPI001F3EEF92|nr:hypothetical protein [Sandaracinus amylolyticus]UJR79932.1 Hypothetical protein I5071_19720 [Sandaracinus amylolyticus]